MTISHLQTCLQALSNCPPDKLELVSVIIRVVALSPRQLEELARFLENVDVKESLAPQTPRDSPPSLKDFKPVLPREWPGQPGAPPRDGSTQVQRQGDVPELD